MSRPLVIALVLLALLIGAVGGAAVGLTQQSKLNAIEHEAKSAKSAAEDASSEAEAAKSAAEDAGDKAEEAKSAAEEPPH
jgi:hypothetical protein